ncbi:hypothetical protein T439DRAFT_320569 [Meredithblackwellia eburnea MCA 4105]
MRFLSLTVTSLLSLATFATARPEKRADQATIISTFDSLASKFESAGASILAALDEVDTVNATLVAKAVDPILLEIKDDISSALSGLKLAKRDGVVLNKRLDVNATAISIVGAISALVAAVEPLKDFNLPSSSQIFNDIMIVLVTLFAWFGIALLIVLNQVARILAELGITDKLKDIFGGGASTLLNFLVV